MNDPRAYQEFEYKNELRSEMATAKNSELEQKKKLKLELTTENPKQKTSRPLFSGPLFFLFSFVSPFNPMDSAKSTVEGSPTEFPEGGGKKSQTL